jgi:pimeloyl-ACP methyl ester carboxylesterase
MPGHGVDDDRAGITNDHCAAALIDFIEGQDLDDVILVGHSWAGTLLSAVTPQLSGRLQRLVYVSAFVLEPGECQLDVLPPAYVESFGEMAAATDDRSMPPPPFELWQQLFMQDAAEEAQRVAWHLLASSPFGCWESKNTVAVRDWDVPKSFISCREDISLPPGEFGWCPRFPERLGEHHLVEIDGSHEACFTQPVKLADAILEEISLS